MMTPTRPSGIRLTLIVVAWSTFAVVIGAVVLSVLLIQRSHKAEMRIQALDVVCRSVAAYARKHDGRLPTQWQDLAETTDVERVEDFPWLSLQKYVDIDFDKLNAAKIPLEEAISPTGPTFAYHDILEDLKRELGHLRDSNTGPDLSGQTSEEPPGGAND